MGRLFNILKKIFFKLFPWSVIVPGVMIIMSLHMTFIYSLVSSVVLSSAVAVFETIIKHRKNS